MPEQTLKDLQALDRCELLKDHPELLVKKLAEFPLAVYALASNLKYILEAKEAIERHGTLSTFAREGELSIDQVITRMAQEIKQKFKDTFGYDIDAPYKVLQSWVS